MGKRYATEKLTQICLSAIIGLSLVLAISVLAFQPASAASAGPDAECDTCTYLGYRVDCYDEECESKPLSKHGVYFHWYCYDRCTGQSSDEWIFQYCHDMC